MKRVLMMVALTLMVSGCACCGICGGGKKGLCGCKGAKCESVKKKCGETRKSECKAVTAKTEVKKSCCGTCK